MFNRSNNSSSFRDIGTKFRNLFTRKSTSPFKEYFLKGINTSKYDTLVGMNNTAPIQTAKLESSSNENQNLREESKNESKSMRVTNYNSLTEELYENVYKNNSSPRGFVFMQNFTEFENDSKLRKGSEIDYENLKALLTHMGYRCDEKNEFCKSGRISAEEFYLNLENFCLFVDHKNVDSAIIVVMSHGSGNKKFLSSDEKKIKVTDICKRLNNIQCLSLIDKPKLLIFQFCRVSFCDNERGKVEIQTENNQYYNVPSQSLHTSLSFLSYSESTSSIGQCPSSSRISSMISTNSIIGLPESDSDFATYINEQIKQQKQLNHTTKISSPVNYDLDSSSISHATDKLQINSDFFLVFSTVGGEVSYRDPKAGSLFITSICNVFKKHASTDDIEDLFKKVSLCMKKSEFDPVNPHAIAVQSCERTNIGLDKKFYLNPPNL